MKDAREQCLALRSARREPVPGRSNVCATAVSPDGYAEGVYGGQTLSSLIPRRLGRGGSRGAVRFREPGSRGPPRFEPSTRGATLLPRELQKGPRLTVTPRDLSRGFASNRRVVRRVCDGWPERSGSLPRKQRTAGRAPRAEVGPGPALCQPEMSRAAE